MSVRCDYRCMAICLCVEEKRMLCVKPRKSLGVGELRGQRSGICGMRAGSSGVWDLFMVS